jgi:ABC-type sugar transport system permease subunit
VTERRLGWLFVAPALITIALIAIFPLGWTFWDSLHRNDLRMPWLGRPFIGIGNYLSIAVDGRFWGAMGHTLFFTTVSVALELIIGLFLALSMHRAFRGRGAVRAAILVPWAIPTVVAALLWRFLFTPKVEWLTHTWLAWIPVITADVWKTTPFVALLLLAGLQNISDDLTAAAAVDGASRWAQMRFVVLPLLRPAIVVALIFRTLDAFRVFDLIYVMTSGGPGTATEPIALYTFNALFQNLRSGYASALSVVVFVVTFGIAVGYIRLLDRKELV